MISADRLRREASAFGVEITHETAEQFDMYARLLTEKNKVMNLTGITEPDAVVTRHFADSLSFFGAVSPDVGSSLIDVGSGAGLPGLAIKIVRPDMKITLIDSTAKRVAFLRETSVALGVNVECIHARAEDAAKNEVYREKFDYVSARAVSEMRVLCEYCLGFLKVGGEFVSLKGREINAELDRASEAISLMGGKITATRRFALSDSSARTIVVIKKISRTPTKYPRVSAQIAKKPL